MRVARAWWMLLFAWLLPATTGAQERRWAADIPFGYAGFVDDATKGYPLAGGAVRRYVSARVSLGPELVVMWNADHVRDRAVLLTGNIVTDLPPFGQAPARVTPFLVGGIGVFWGRDIVRGGPYWSSDPAFTAGGGVRVQMTARLAAVAEYRIGWELHQRVSGGVTATW